MKNQIPTEGGREIKRALYTYPESGIEVDYTLLYNIDGDRFYYSVRVSKRGSRDSVTVSDITGDRSAAERIFRLLSEGGVTPVCATEVIEDLIEII